VDSTVDLITAMDKKTMMFQYVMLDMLEKELEANQIVVDCKLGDALLFWELNPHRAEKCTIKRDVLYVRLVSRDAKVDEEFIKAVDEVVVKPDEKLNFVDTKENFVHLHKFLTGTKRSFERSLELVKEQKK